MALDNSDADVHETRILAQKLWSQCRDTTGQYKELSADLRRLRNLLEDVEEHTAEDASLDPLSTQILQCKAILCGLDTNLKSSQCSAQSQPEAFLAHKASVQVVTHSLSVVFEALIAPAHIATRGTNGLLTTSLARQASSYGVPGNGAGVATATNVTLSLQNSARIISLSSCSPSRTGDSSRQNVDGNNHESDLSPCGNERVHAVSPMPADWQSPFSIPDPLAFDNSRACTILTDPRLLSTSTVPDIVVSTCAKSDNNVLEPTDILQECLSLECETPTLEDCPGSDQVCASNLLPQSSTRRESENGTGPPCTMYVPYRPWYEPTNKIEKHLEFNTVQEPSDDRHEVGPSGVVMARASSRPIGSQKTKQPDPPAPLRLPPVPPPSPIARSRRKPPVPPRRRAYRVADSEHLMQQSHHRKEASHATAQPVTRLSAQIGADFTTNSVKLPYLDELKCVLNRKPMLQRRSIIGELCMDTDNDLSASFGANRISRAQSMEVYVKTYLPHSEVRRSRSASAPGLTTPRPRPPAFPRLAELPVESTVATVHTGHTADVELGESDQTRQATVNEAPGSVDPSLTCTRMANICDSWNTRNWPKAESYLTHHLSVVQSDRETARRVCHLLGVCASYRGHWQRALIYFVSVVNKPVRELNQLDRADKAAFYWLGDTYCLLNRKEEALLAYCLAGSCDRSASTSFLPCSRRCLMTNQEQLRQTVSKSSFKDIWADASFHHGHGSNDGILHCTVVTQTVAQNCLESCAITADRCSRHAAKNISSVQALNHKTVSDMLLIAPSHLAPTSAWPMPHDPTFDLQNVAQGSLVAKHSDIINVLLTSPEMLYFTRWYSPNLSGWYSVELSHLITAVREGLQTLAMRWHEVVSITGVFFLVQYDSVGAQVATINYFRIEVTRSPLRKGFGLNFCSENTGSARRTSRNLKADGSFDAATKRELKRCLRAAIESACTQPPRACLSTTSRTLPTLLQRTRIAPLPTPPRVPTESSMSPAELETPHSTPQSSVDLSTLVPPIVSDTPSAPVDSRLSSRARARTSIRSSYNERHMLGPLVR